MHGLLLLASAGASGPAAAKAFFRVAPSALPAPDKTAIEELVLAWPLRDALILGEFRNQGYHVWLQCDAKDVAPAIQLAERTAVRGLIITNVAESKQFPGKEIGSYAAKHENLAFRVLLSGGKQPQMRGRLVVERDGILQVSSPSTQPWLDTNLAVVRLGQSVYPDSSFPLMYDFHWATPEIPAGAWYPDVEDYALAIAESDAIRTDVIIDLPTSLQRALVAGEAQAWSLWSKVVPYLYFSSHAPMANVQPVAGLGVVVSDGRASYEAVNLMARHNLAFEAVRPSGLKPERLANWNSVVVFCPLPAEATAELRGFATKGGIVLFVNPHQEFPWHSTTPLRREAHATTYAVGAGQIVELGEPVIDPEDFARDLRRLIGRERSMLALWNSLTALAIPYREQGQRGTLLYLVNYADQPENLQVQIKGHFTGVRLESPEENCCVSLRFVERNGFIEFTVPSLRVAARVHLDFREAGTTAQ
jgi:hypothetical protein